MNKFTRLAAALGGAAMVVAAGTAFTAANTMSDNPVMGSGSNTVSGVTVTSAAYTYNAAETTLNQIVYTVNAMPDVNVAAYVTPTGGSLTFEDCVITSSTIITCGNATDLNPAALGWTVSDLTAIRLTVAQTSA